MRFVWLTMVRTHASLRERWSSVLAVTVFLSATAAVFVHSLYGVVGTGSALSTLWALSLAPLGPVLAALLGMDVWSEDIRTGGIDLLLTSPISEFDLALGRFLGVYRAYVRTLLLSLAAAFAVSRAFSVDASVGLLSFVLPLGVLLVQGALWCAVVVCCSSLTRQGAVAAVLSVLLTVGIPRGIWSAILLWSPVERSVWGEMPLDAHVADFASGLVVPGVIVSYLLAALVFVFVSSRFVRARRLIGGGQSGARLANRTVVLLSVLCAVASVALFLRLHSAFELPVSDAGELLDGRTRGILSECTGTMRMTLLRSRKAPDFRSLARLMRAFRLEADSLGGLTIELRYADPNWDIAEATRLVRLGAADGSIVLERGRQSVLVSGATGRSEREIASAIVQLVNPSHRRSVCWVCGHGEHDFSSYAPTGMSDIARELSRDGFVNVAVDLARDNPLPSDCAFVIVAGAQDDFSRAELKRVNDYLGGGGRLLVLADDADVGGLRVILPSWGVRMSSSSFVAPSMGKGNVIVSDFSRHPVAMALQGKRIVLENPLSLAPSAAVQTGTGADRLEFMPLASCGSMAVAACVERGVGAGSDLSIRPTRIVVIGDSNFAQNGCLAAFGGANRDLVLNCASYLAGVDSLVCTGGGEAGGSVGLDRTGFLRMAGVDVVFVPLFVLFVLIVRRRQRRWSR